MERRVVFTFDEKSFSSLKQIIEDGGYQDMAAAVKDSLCILNALLHEGNQKNAEIILRSPKTNREKVFIWR